MEFAISVLISGVSVGGQYALIAIGYTMVYGILRLINFAHGDVFMVAGLLGIYLSGPDEGFLIKYSEILGKMIRGRQAEGLTVIGPAAAVLSRKNDIYRRVIYLKHREEAVLLDMEKRLEQELEKDTVWQKIYIQFDHNRLNAY